MTQLADETLGAKVRVEGEKIQVTDGCTDGSLYFQTDRMPPLGLDEPHVILKASGEDFTATIKLDGYHLDALADAINNYQEELRDHE